jgi:hypothetical protein
MKSDDPVRLPAPSSRRGFIGGVGATLLISLLCREADASKRQRRSAKKKSSSKKARKRSSEVASSRFQNPAIISGESLFRDVVEYYNLGEHRTASPGDLKTSDWMARELRAAGAAATFQRFTVNQYFPRETSRSSRQRLSGLFLSGRRVRPVRHPFERRLSASLAKPVLGCWEAESPW